MAAMYIMLYKIPMNLTAKVTFNISTRVSAAYRQSQVGIIYPTGVEKSRLKLSTDTAFHVGLENMNKPVKLFEKDSARVETICLHFIRLYHPSFCLQQLFSENILDTQNMTFLKFIHPTQK